MNADETGEDTFEGEDANHRIDNLPGPIPGMKVYQQPFPDFLDPLETPAWVPAAEAAHMRDGDFVLGISTDSAHYALPWWVMKNHHVANLTIEGQDLLIVLCENCSSAAAFDPRVAGERHRFQVAGTYRGTFFLHDYETGSYWAPFLGGGLYGPLASAELTPLPLYQSSWAEWKALHPDSLVEAGTGEPRDGHGAGTEPGSLLKIEKNMVKAVDRDRRLRPNVLVLGVTAGDESRAYPLRELHNHSPALNDELGGRPIVIVSQPGSVMALAFAREVDSRTLTFETPDGQSIRDHETGSTWDMDGNAIAGPLTGRRLSFVQSLISEWYEYAASHPEVPIFGTMSKAELDPRYSPTAG